MDVNVAELVGKLYIGPQVQSFVEPAFELFHKDGFAPNLAAWLLIVAGLCAATFAIQVSVASVRLGRAIRHLAKIETQQDFKREFPSVDKTISRVPFLRHGWNEFKDTLVPNESAGTIQNTLRPGDFINILEAEHSGLRIRWFQPLGGVFVGIGLLLTFIGLVAALYFASQGIDGGGGGDALKRTQASLVQLLSAATFKFWTSIAGLFSSIVLGFVHRFGVGWVQRRIERLCNEIERGMVVLTAEMIAQRHLEEMEKQGVQLREFNGQLAFTIGQGVEQALKAAMPQIMSTAMEPVSLGLKEVTGNLGQMNETALKTMTEDFSRTLQQGAGSEIKAVATTLDATRGTIEAIGTKIEGATHGLEGAIVALSESAQALVSGLDRSADRTKDTVDEQLKRTQQTLEGNCRPCRQFAQRRH